MAVVGEWNPSQLDVTLGWERLLRHDLGVAIHLTVSFIITERDTGATIFGSVDWVGDSHLSVIVEVRGIAIDHLKTAERMWN